MKPLLTWTLLGALAVYHVVNLWRHETLKPNGVWRRVHTELKVDGLSIFSIPHWIRAHPEDFQFVSVVNGKPVHSDIQAPDASARYLAITGYSMRYLARQVRNDMILGERTPHQRLYWKEEIPFQLATGVERIERGFVPQLRAFVKSLESRGVTVVMLPVPLKISLERPRLPKMPKSDVWAFAEDRREDPDRVYRTLVDSDPTHVVDVLSVYRSYLKANPESELYVPTDSHWSSLGIALAAQAVVGNLRERGWTQASPELVGEGDDRVRYDHDLIRHLQLPEWLLARLPEFHWREPLYRLSPAPASTRGRIVLSGASHSHRWSQSPYGLGRLLAEALGRELVDGSTVGGGTLGSLKDMKARGITLQPGDLFVLESTLRHPFPEPVLPDFEVRPATTPIL